VCIHCSKEFCHGISPMNILYFNQISVPTKTLPYLLPTPNYSIAFSAFLSCHLTIKMQGASILFTLCHSLFFLLSLVPSNNPAITDMFFIYMYIDIIMFVFVYTFIFWVYLPHVGEKKSGLLHLAWLSPGPSIYLQIKFYCVYRPQFLNLFISCRVPVLFPQLGDCE
jgi:hypothetical protein